jgi:hypothetical protein
MLRLNVRKVEATLAKCALLFGTRMHIDSACAAVVTDALHGDVVYDCSVVDMNVGDRHVGHATVIEKSATSPIASCVASAEISEAVVHATVKADVRAPISGVPEVVPF